MNEHSFPVPGNTWQLGRLVYIALSVLTLPAGDLFAAAPADAATQFRQAQSAAASGRLADATRLTTQLLNHQALADRGLRLRAASLLVEVYNASGRYQDAVRVGQLFVPQAAGGSGSSALLRELAAAYSEMDEQAKAEALLVQALQIANRPDANPMEMLDVLGQQALVAQRHAGAAAARARWSALQSAAEKMLRELPATSSRRIACTSWLAKAHAEQGRVPEAIKLVREVLAADTRRADLRAQVADLLELARLQARNADDRARLDSLERAAAIQKQVKPAEPALAADIELRLAAACQALGRFSAAREHWLAAATAFEGLVRVKPAGDSDIQRQVVFLGRLQSARQALRQFDLAVPVARRLLALRNERLDPADPRIFETKNSLGMYLGAVGQLDEARSLLESAANYWRARRPSAERDLVTSLNNLAVVDRDLGEFSAAVTVLDEALRVSREHSSPDDLLLAETVVNRAAVDAAQGHFAAAVDGYQSAARLFRTAGPASRERLAGTLADLASAYASQQEFAPALEAASEAVELQRSVCAPRDPALLPSLLGLATLYVQQDQWAEAAEPLAEAAELVRDWTRVSPRQAARVLYLHGLVQYRQTDGDRAEAGVSWRTALELAKTGQDRVLEARLLNYMGELAIHQADWTRAADLLRQSAELEEKLQAFPAFHFITLCNYAQVLRQQGQNDKSVGALRRAIELVEVPRAGVHGAEGERARYFAQFSRAFDLLVDWYVEAGQYDEALAVAERARNRTFLDQLRAGGVDLADTLQGTEAEALAGKSRALADRVAGLQLVGQSLELSGAGAKRLARIETQLCTLREEQTRLWTEIRNASPFYRDLLAHDPAADLSRVAYDRLNAANELILSYYLGLEHGYVFVWGSRAGKLQVYPLEITPELKATLGVELDWLSRPLASVAVGRWLGVLSRPGRVSGTRSLGAKVVSRKAMFTSPQAQAFAELVLPPAVRERIAASGAAVVTIIPDGALSEMPFEALPLDGEHFALDVLPPLDYAPSAMILASLLNRHEPRSTRGPAVVTLGDPQYGTALAANEQSGTRRVAYVDWQRRLAPLPFTRDECQRVARTFGSRATLLAGAKASEVNLRASIADHAHSGEPYFLHVAAHGIVDEQHQNLFGAIALTPDASAARADRDGFLMLNEIYGLPLAGCELAVLSACETNVGTEQPLEAGSSLARAFLAAGAERVVSSHWSVDDRATAELVGRFFEQLARTSSDPRSRVRYAQSLHQARLAVAHDTQHPEWASPYYWAAFTLTGPADSLSDGTDVARGER